jgi:hypothetical protein
VPRWIPAPAASGRQPSGAAPPDLFSWTDTLFSERGTLLAIAAGYILIAAKLFIE